MNSVILKCNVFSRVVFGSADSFWVALRSLCSAQEETKGVVYLFNLMV